MKKYLVLIAIVMVLAFAGTVIAEEQFLPPRNNTGQIGKSGRVWREGNFYTGNFNTVNVDDTITATADLYYITTASHDFGHAKGIWTLSADEAKSRILFASGASPDGCTIIAPGYSRSYLVYNFGSTRLLVKATGGSGWKVATMSGQEVIFFKLTGSTNDYVLAGASFPIVWGP
jgi:hypothetical protein